MAVHWPILSGKVCGRHAEFREIRPLTDRSRRGTHCCVHERLFETAGPAATQLFWYRAGEPVAVDFEPRQIRPLVQGIARQGTRQLVLFHVQAPQIGQEPQIGRQRSVYIIVGEFQSHNGTG